MHDSQLFLQVFHLWIGQLNKRPACISGSMLLLTPAVPAQFAYTDEFGDPCKNFAKCAADLMVMVRPSTMGWCWTTPSF